MLNKTNIYAEIKALQKSIEEKLEKVDLKEAIVNEFNENVFSEKNKRRVWDASLKELEQEDDNKECPTERLTEN